MTWKSHKAVTFATILAVTGNIPAAVLGALGSIVPDRIEGPLWRHWHRTYSHWFLLYLPVVVLCYPYRGVFLDGPFRWHMGAILFWVFLGALLHIPEDAICGKIPVWSPKKKMTVFPRLFYVGSFGEYVFVVCYCIGLVFLKMVVR